MLLTDHQKRIYNTHLAVSRHLRQKPFRLRTDFSNIESEKVTALKKLATFSFKWPDLNLQEYFAAPYKLYPDVEYFSLTYFASMKAITAYSIYKKQLEIQAPDSQINNIRESLSYITKFCIDNKIQLDDYPLYKKNGIEPEWMYHMKRGKITPYVMFEFSNIFSLIQDIPEDERTLLLGNFGQNFLEYRSRYNESKKLKPFLKEAYQKVKFFIDKELNSPN
jgi:hypothetical protein